MIHNKWLRVLTPVILIAIWLSLGALGGPTFGKISEVTTNDRAAFLPASAESTRVQQLQSSYSSGTSIPAIILIESEKPFGPTDIASSKLEVSKLAKIEGVQGGVVGPISSNDRRALEFIAQVSTKSELKIVVESLRNEIQKDLPDSHTAYVTGPAGLSADLSEAFGGIDGLLLAVALTAVFIILLFVYRSLLLPILVLVNAVFALCAAIFVVYLLAKNGVVELNGQSQGILFILVIGAATDYSLLLVARYREALKHQQDTWTAIVQGIRGSFEPILASAATVILALLCLLFSDLNSNRSLGPIAATGIVFALLSTLTFLPALLKIFGRAAFWPSKVAAAKTKEPTKMKTGKEELTGIWQRIGDLVTKRSRATWMTIIALLAISCLGLFQLQASGVPQTELVLTKSNAADGQKAIARHFSAGSGAPTLVAVPQDSIDTALNILRSNKNIANVTLYGAKGQVNDPQEAKIVDGKALLSATLTIDPYSEKAGEFIHDLRDELDTRINGALVGGTSALEVDTNETAIHDFKKITPLVLGMIFIVLACLLRALVAPLILIFTVMLSFAAALGISALVFNHIFGFPGADPGVPLFSFVFLVALGVDYNIFLISRTREEALKFSTKVAIPYSLGKTGGVITSAGIVLAATFAALGVIPILFLAQIAFIVAFGVLLDALIVRSLLVPALFNSIGPKVWWPSKIK